MKRTVSCFLAIIFSFSLLTVSVSASPQKAAYEPEDVQAKDLLTYEEMVAWYARSGGMTYEEALQHFPAQRGRASNIYHVFNTVLNVASNYKPTLEFYCEVSIGDGVWGIMSIYSVQMVRSYHGASKQYSGDIEVWLRSPHQIEYVVNGDFYNNGMTTTTGTLGGRSRNRRVWKALFLSK